MGSISPCFTYKLNVILPKFFPKNSSPKIIDVERVQRIPDIMAPTILRKMGSISPCFTHKPQIIPPKALPQKFFPTMSSQKLFPEKYFPKFLPQKCFPNNYWHRMGAKKVLTSWPQQFWEKWAAFRPVLHTNQKLFSKNSSPRILSPKILPQQLLTSNGCKKNIDIMAPTILGKMGSISPCFTQTKYYSPKILPKIPPKFFSKYSLTSNGCKRFLPSWPQQFWEEWEAFRPVLHKPTIIPKNVIP